ncbi:hypothetical protein DRE_02149 [Drechslerella stenobrocha 248]|uniref:Uncharacterized protein n=1 Tax=Drechslerella stenobrocha 248 TaxID=1043628 RepID=W7IGP5_9PEZI|nr:hypothetical protein DRE_02149 [Drechslerella stenobrocha 248]
MVLDLTTLNIERDVVAKFDRLVDGGEIIWGPSEAEYVVHEGFQLEFQLAPALLKKPILSRHAPDRSKPYGPFSNPDPNFVVAQIDDTHTLIFSKFCVPRPHLVLHTNVFALQTDDLTASDLSSAWRTLGVFAAAPAMMIYNCGVDAGSSQGHKHMQVFPKPDIRKFQLFPDRCRAMLPKEGVVTLPDTPYKHYVVALPNEPSQDDIVGRHNKVVELAKAALGKDEGAAYNIVMTKDWVMAIPRRSKGNEGVGANAAGMMGMIWVGSQEERDCWTTFGLTRYLQTLGVPV